MEIVDKSTTDCGLGLGGFKAKKLTILAKWGWPFLEEEDSLWHKVVKSIHGSDTYNWHTVGKDGRSLRNPWVSTS